jgi:hypothetical protein
MRRLGVINLSILCEDFLKISLQRIFENTKLIFSVVCLGLFIAACDASWLRNKPESTLTLQGFINDLENKTSGERRQIMIDLLECNFRVADFKPISSLNPF